MNLKNKLKSYNFWISVSAGVVLIFQLICEVFNLNISSDIMLSILSGLCGLLVIAGVVSPGENKSSSDIKEDIENKLNKLEDEDMPDEDNDN